MKLLLLEHSRYYYHSGEAEVGVVAEVGVEAVVGVEVKALVEATPSTLTSRVASITTKLSN